MLRSTLCKSTTTNSVACSTKGTTSRTANVCCRSRQCCQSIDQVVNLSDGGTNPVSNLHEAFYDLANVMEETTLLKELDECEEGQTQVVQDLNSKRHTIDGVVNRLLVLVVELLDLLQGWDDDIHNHPGHELEGVHDDLANDRCELLELRNHLLVELVNHVRQDGNDVLVDVRPELLQRW